MGMRGPYATGRKQEPRSGTPHACPRAHITRRIRARSSETDGAHQLVEILEGLQYADDVAGVREAFERMARQCPGVRVDDLELIADRARRLRKQIDSTSRPEAKNHIANLEYEFINKLCDRRLDGPARQTSVLVAIIFVIAFFEREFLNYLIHSGAGRRKAEEILEDVRASLAPCLDQCVLTDRCIARQKNCVEDCSGVPPLRPDLKSLIYCALEERIDRLGPRLLRAERRTPLSLDREGFNPLEQLLAVSDGPATEEAAGGLDADRGSAEPVADAEGSPPSTAGRADEIKRRLRAIRKRLSPRFRNRPRRLEAEARWYSTVHEADRQDRTNDQIRDLLREEGCTWNLDGHEFCDRILRIRRDTYRWVGVEGLDGLCAHEMVLLACDLLRLGIAKALPGAAAGAAQDAPPRKGIHRLAQQVNHITRFLASQWSRESAERNRCLPAKMRWLGEEGHWSRERYPGLHQLWECRLQAGELLPWHDYWRTVRLDCIKQLLKRLKKAGIDLPRSDDLP